MPEPSPIRVYTRRVTPAELTLHVGRPFPDMVKFVVDIDRRIVALGGELHVDAEAVLLDADCRQTSLWGGNYYPKRPENECVEFNSLINVRPSQGNLTLEIASATVRERMRAIICDFVGRGAAS